jgi:nicotinic acid mononucleotide adenylyltransferase
LSIGKSKENPMKKIVFTFGRMNPPTIGHQKLVDKVNAVAKSNRADARVYLSHTSVQTDPKNKKDPLSYREKIKFATKAFGSIIKVSQSKTIIQIAQELEKSGYTDLILVVGSDRVSEFKKLLTKYNGKDYTFDSIEVVSAGERDPDAEGVEGMSASKLRALAKAGDFDTFKTGLPPKIQGDAKKVYDIINNVIREEVDMEEDRKPLSIQQRQQRARQMKRLAPKLARSRKLKAKRLADVDTLKKRAAKLAKNIVRKKVTGERGADYKNLGTAEKITIDKLVIKKSALINKLAKKLLPKVRKSEQERLKMARSTKSEEFNIDELFEATVTQDKDIKDREGTQPKKYFKDLSKSTKEKRDASFKAGKKASDDDPKAYKPAPGDAEAKTKPSKHTLKYKKMFGEKSELQKARDEIGKEKKSDKEKFDRMQDQARLRDTVKKNQQTEEYELSEDASASLKKKSEKSGIPYSTLKKVYDRGMAAWKTGHRPGATQQQWGFARVNSFITKGKGTWGGADKDLAKGVKEERDYKKEYENYQGKPEQIARRSSRNKARRIMGDKAVKGKDVGHKDNNPLNNDPKNLRMEDPSKNRREPRLREEIEEACWDGYKQVGMKKKGGKMVPDCVPETKEASNPAQQAAIAISKKEKAKKEDKVVCPKCKGDGCDHCDNTGYHDKVNASNCMSEDWFTKLMNKYVLKPRTYKYAREVLRQVLDKKKKEGKLKHSVEYYAQQIAKQYNGVDARDLAKMVTEEGGAGEEGTDKLRKRYEKDTPTEKSESVCCEDCEEYYDHTLEESEYQGRKVTLNDPFRNTDGNSKFSVYVKNEKGNVVKVNFGDPNMEIKRDDPKRRKSFRARHNCDNPGPKWKARYWSCYQWRSGSKVDN